MDLKKPCETCGKLCGPDTFSDAIDAELLFRAQVGLPGRWRPVARIMLCDDCFQAINSTFKNWNLD